jgi:lipase
MRLHVHEWGDAQSPTVVCLHGVTAHGERFRQLAEERWASRFHVVAPDLRGHGRSSWEPPWTFAQHVADLAETFPEPAFWLGHSFGGRLVLELAGLDADRVDRAVLLDRAIQVLPHVAFDFAERERVDRAYDSPEQPIDERLAMVVATPREYLEEENREHLVQHPDGKFRFRYCQAAVVSMYGELCTPPPAPETLSMPTLLVYSGQFGLVREEQLQEYERALGGGIEIVEVPGGHIVYWDAFDDTADAIDAFLQDPRAES